MRTRFLLAALPLFAAVAAVGPAFAAGAVHDEITLEELEVALDNGFAVKRQTTKNGTFLIVQGKENTIGAQLTHCGDDVRCEGVEFFAPVKKKYTAAQVNEFNATYSYAKMLLNAKGDVWLRLEMYTAGGVTADNIVANGAMLMLRQDMANGAGDGLEVSLDKPAPIARLSAERIAPGPSAPKSKTSAAPLQDNPVLFAPLIQFVEGDERR